jgi:hypothetical protein
MDTCRPWRLLPRELVGARRFVSSRVVRIPGRQGKQNAAVHRSYQLIGLNRAASSCTLATVGPPISARGRTETTANRVAVWRPGFRVCEPGAVSCTSHLSTPLQACCVAERVGGGAPTLAAPSATQPTAPPRCASWLSCPPAACDLVTMAAVLGRQDSFQTRCDPPCRGLGGRLVDFPPP